MSHESERWFTYGVSMDRERGSRNCAGDDEVESFWLGEERERELIIESGPHRSIFKLRPSAPHRAGSPRGTCELPTRSGEILRSLSAARQTSLKSGGTAAPKRTSRNKTDVETQMVCCLAVPSPKNDEGEVAIAARSPDGKCR